MEQLSEERLVIRLKEVDSTNNYLKSLVRDQRPEEGSMIIADFQLGGRGQMGNGWYSEKGKNLLFSLLIYPDGVPANEQFIISRIASLAVKNTLDQFTDDIRIKWPNDIYWKDKKIAGMLIENDIQGKNIENSVIGIGININQDEFPEELPNPVSLKQIVGSEQDRDYILDTFIREFFLLYRELQNGDVRVIEDEYMLDLYRINDYYWFEDENGRFKAMIKAVQPSGYLVLKALESGEERVYAFKEVSFVD
ncbi:MAG: biotin--[acetyl-CoA-carboxylase] ligase [Fermentimonas sp.]|jgi:BirA family biotin operon repressor/biotin-[acetyl-CoA-carboxylase] ligase|nr:biotin--[acetyl-CoA-carboxylase] ligase [Fermentimonas sp.]MDD4009755.1 biotin--[acetyl-CoA-carboxylase] ligase [Fermentimonas sp.]MDD4696477.1 biotin--[acetyl-CoA-carboxylase] ligase [Fermentimonas sp.]